MGCSGVARAWVGLGFVVVLGLVAPRAEAFEFFDGRLQVHGFYESQIRGMAADFSLDDGLDLTQWYNILNIEIEAELLPDGWGPIDYAAAFVRLEARYDCVWTRGCGTMPSANTFGDRARRLPGRLSSARRSGLTGTLPTGDTRRLHTIPIEELGFEFRDAPVPQTSSLAFIWHVPGVDTLFGVEGLDGVLGTPDDPAAYTFARFINPVGQAQYRWASREVLGSEGGTEKQLLGPWKPENWIINAGALADRANPFNPLDFNPSSMSVGSTALPYRPPPNIAAAAVSPNGNPAEPRGLFIPNHSFARILRDNDFDDFDQNFSQNQLAWNHGASQEQTRELKEAYFDLEFFESQLWVRAGRQSIVWGKTELFRTTDQFNPVDLALASLPSLEEARVPLWAVRGVWSFGTLGPVEDLRFEVAVNVDDFTPNDLGRCGEPYSPNPVCNKTIGGFASGVVGIGLGGERRPPLPWDDASGTEIGARVEFRAGPVSVAITDFWGYSDLPYIEKIFTYERNVDPRTGRIRRLNSRLGCDPEGLFDGDTRGCLKPGDDALFNTAANQQRFAVICSSSVGFSDLDRSVCAQSIFNSSNQVADFAGFPIAPTDAFGLILAGHALGDAVLGGLVGLMPTGATIANPFGGSVIVPLNADVNDGGIPSQSIFCTTPLVRLLTGTSFPQCLSERLTDEQEALLGCGPLFGTNCDAQGIDLLNAELGTLMQSWPGFPGTFGDWDTFDAHTPQPGTVGFEGGAVCTRYEGGHIFILPGCRGPGDENYDPGVDGTITGLVHPFTGQQFRTEMAALSWNYLVTLVALSGLGKADDDKFINEFKTNDAYRLGACSLRQPQFCSNPQAIYSIAHTTRKTLRAGGTGRYGRVDSDWHVGGQGVIRYAKRNVLGFSMDFAEDRTKTSWSLEATWINDFPQANNDEFNGLTDVDTYNLTVSIDRPTFVNFLNANRTLFFNTQWFFQYVEGHKGSFPSSGPWNVLMTFTINTGYFQDRLLQAVTFVYDFQSNSGAILPNITWRFTQNFSAQLGVAVFYGRFQNVVRPIAGVGSPPYAAGGNRENTFTERGLSAVRDRDEIFARIRYTF